MVSLPEILKYFGIDEDEINNLNQLQIIYLIRKYYSEVASSA